jgi:peptidoglycan glycosyltransferase
MRARVAVAGLMAHVLLLSGCEAAIDAVDEGPEPVAERLVEVWNAEDFEAVSELLVTTGAEDDRWHSGALRVQFERVLRQAEATDFDVSIDGVTEEEDPSGRDSATVQYSITYDSSAAAEPVTLTGGRLQAFEIDGEWKVDWSNQVPFAGQDRATRFRVERKWLKRGSILDRQGRRLAVGSESQRRYPQGSLAGTTVGHLEPAPKKSGIDRLVGASGLEAAFDERMAGRPKTKLVLVDSSGETIAVLGRRKGRPGRDVKSTLDIDMQSAAQTAFGSTIGGAVVVDPRKGDLLAAVSSSPFDPGNYVGVPGIEPFDRSLSGLYPPGSSLKVMTAAAALDTKTMRVSSTLTGPKEYRGVRNFESGEFGTIDFATALKYSVNTAFAQIALKLGAAKLHRYSSRFGFNGAPTMQLQAATSSFPKPLDEGDLMWGSIGQAQVLSTPLQMATVAATIANRGKRMEPRIDLRTRPQGRRAVSVKTARTMTRLMRDVVIGGTGSAANITGLEVAGKTGTAEVDIQGVRKNHAWFVCFAPASNPRVAVAVVSEYGGVGGVVAAPIAASILTGITPFIRR